MNKLAFIAVLAVAAYFFVIKDPYPDTINFHGHTFSSKEDHNNSSNDLDIYKYSDSSKNHNFMFAISNDAAVTLTDLSEVYLNLFKQQGFKFKEQDNRHLGIHKDTVIYIANSGNINGVVVFATRKDASTPTAIGDANSIFFDLETFIL